MKKHWLLPFVFVCAGLAAGAQTYDVAADFSAANNPNGPWSYGYSLTLGGPLTLYTDTLNISGLDLWLHNIAGYAPCVNHNPTTDTILLNSEVYEPGAFTMHPGPDDEYSVARLTIPAPSLYHITGSFFGENAFPTTTDVHILINNGPVLDGEVTGFGPGSGPSIDLQVTLSAGDQLDFAVGYGTNGWYGFDSTGLSAQIVALVLAPPSLSIAKLSANTVRIGMQLVLGGTYQLESSADLSAWGPEGGPFEPIFPDVFQDFDVSLGPKFFRLARLR